MANIEAGQERVYEKNTDINEVCGFIYNQYSQEALEKNLLLNVSLGLQSTDSVISTDKTKLTQILSNLVGNAIKFTLNGEVNFGYNQRNGFIEFFVKDTGIGIEKELQEEIFQRFRQADYSHTRKFGGSGLGLSISKAYIEMLGGNIWLNSEPNKGSEFYFTIPIQMAREEIDIEATRVDENAYLGPTKNILVVEDEECNFFLVEEILKTSNFSILYAQNGKEAIEYCYKRKDIDLILMDLKMPIMGGYEATAKIREFYAPIPIIAQTAFTQDYDRNHAMESGFTDYISKPFKVPQLLQMVKKYILEG
jgi:CheY-like chemotaxis protein